MKNKIKTIVLCSIFLLLVFGSIHVLNYLLSDDVRSFTRLKMHEMYTMEENIDSLFVGSSHCNRSLNPFVVSSITGENAFNGASNLQLLDASFAVIKEANKYHKLKKVFVEISYYIATESEQKKRTELTPIYRISDFMKLSKNKIRFLMDASSSEHYSNSFIIARRNNMKIFDKEFIANQIKQKSTDAYKNYEYFDIIYREPIYGRKYKEKYIGNGFSESHGVLPEKRNCLDLEKMLPVNDNNNISSDFKKNMKKIIDYCKSNNIEVVFFGTPSQDFYLYYKNYDNYVKQITEILNPLDVEFYDFNLCKPEYLKLEAKHFSDPDHTNFEGAKIFSKVFSNLLMGKYKENIFYSSFDEKLTSIDSTVFGLSYVKNEGKMQINILKNFEEEVQVYTEKTTKNNEKEKQKYNTVDNIVITYPKEEHGKIRVIVVHSGVKVNYSYINY